jgi:hypothetical protein
MKEENMMAGAESNTNTALLDPMKETRAEHMAIDLEDS